MRALTVLDPGPLTTVQDGGRPGLAHLGVPRSGWLDAPAARLGNRLVGNKPGAAGLETHRRRGDRACRGGPHGRGDGGARRRHGGRSRRRLGRARLGACRRRTSRGAGPARAAQLPGRVRRHRRASRPGLPVHRQPLRTRPATAGAGTGPAGRPRSPAPARRRAPTAAGRRRAAGLGRAPCGLGGGRGTPPGGDRVDGRGRLQPGRPAPDRGGARARPGGRAAQRGPGPRRRPGAARRAAAGASSPTTRRRAATRSWASSRPPISGSARSSGPASRCGSGRTH